MIPSDKALLDFFHHPLLYPIAAGAKVTLKGINIKIQIVRKRFWIRSWKHCILKTNGNSTDEQVNFFQKFFWRQQAIHLLSKSLDKIQEFKMVGDNKN